MAKTKLEQVIDYLDSIDRDNQLPVGSIIYTRDGHTLEKISGEREQLIRRLLKALYGLPRERQFSVLTSWMSLDQLRDLVKFQER